MRRSGNRRPLPRPSENHLTRYEPVDSFETPRFSDVRTFMRLSNTRDFANADALLAATVAHEFLSLLAFSKKSGPW